MKLSAAQRKMLLNAKAYAATVARDATKAGDMPLAETLTAVAGVLMDIARGDSKLELVRED